MVGVLGALVFWNGNLSDFLKGPAARHAWSQPAEAVNDAARSMAANEPIDPSKPGYSPEQREFLSELAAIDDERAELEAKYSEEELYGYPEDN
jgi:hypothetical protein